MTADLTAYAKERGIKYFLINFTDLFGMQRAKLVPTQAIAGMQKSGAGFAGFATWLDMTPAHPDMFAMPDPSSRHPASLEERHRLGRLRPHDGRQARRAGAARDPEEAHQAGGRQGLSDQIRRRARVSPDLRRRQIDRRPSRYPGETLLRPAGADPADGYHHRDLRLHARARLGPLPERPRGRERPVRDELGLRRRPHYLRPARLLQIHDDARSPRNTVCARPSCPSPSPISPATAATCISPSGAWTARPTCSTIPRARSA